MVEAPRRVLLTGCNGPATHCSNGLLQFLKKGDLRTGRKMENPLKTALNAPVSPQRLKGNRIPVCVGQFLDDRKCTAKAVEVKELDEAVCEIHRHLPCCALRIGLGHTYRTVSSRSSRGTLQEGRGNCTSRRKS